MILSVLHEAWAGQHGDLDRSNVARRGATSKTIHIHPSHAIFNFSCYHFIIHIFSRKLIRWTVTKFITNLWYLMFFQALKEYSSFLLYVTVLLSHIWYFYFHLYWIYIYIMHYVYTSALHFPTFALLHPAPRLDLVTSSIEGWVGVSRVCRFRSPSKRIMNHCVCRELVENAFYSQFATSITLCDSIIHGIHLW